MKSKLQFSDKDFLSASAWLYQMSSGGSGGRFRSSEDKPWYPSSYRDEVNEGEPITWDLGKIYFRTRNRVYAGDTVVFFFCKSGKKDPQTHTIEPGIYGLGTIIDPPLDSNGIITFEVKPPSDYLKNYVIWDAEIEWLTNEIRQRQYQGTMWPINNQQLGRLCRKIHHHIKET